MSKRWLGLALCAGAISQCSLVTDFDGVADGRPDGSAGAAGATAEPRFPRLAAFETANPKDFDDPAHQEDVSRLDLSIMGVYPGWEEAHGPVEQVVKNVKALNPDTRLFVVVSAASFENTTSGNAYQTVIDKLNDQSWWLYESGTGGTIVTSPFSGQYATNTTLFTPKDADGLTFVEWFARWAVDAYYVQNPSLDGFYVNAPSNHPLVSGDFDRDGTSDDENDPDAGTWHRQGYRRLFDDLKTLAPSKLVLGDLGRFDDVGAVTTEVENVLHGGLLLAQIGEPYSPETSSWNAMMSLYRKAMASVVAPKLVVFQIAVTATDYQTLRYGLGSCLLDDGYFAVDDVDGSWGIDWFDEFDADLGAATSPPPEVPWSNGVYRRDFENGMVLVNPRGNGPATVELEQGFVHLTGIQDPIVNNGAAATSVTLADRDAVILLRGSR